MTSPTFPHIYLFKEVSPRTAARKAREGLCKHWGCTRPAREHKRDCETCKSRKRRAKDPVRYAYEAVRESARKRGVGFNLAFEEFVEFDRQTGYVKSKGQSAECLSIDRIKSDKGYEVGNIRALTWIENCRRRCDGMTNPAEPIAQMLANHEGHGIWQLCGNRANGILEMVEILLAQRDGGFEPVMGDDEVPF